MSKPGKVLKRLCKRLKVRLTVKRNGKRVYKSVKVLKRQCAKKKKKVRRRRFGADRMKNTDLLSDVEFFVKQALLKEFLDDIEGTIKKIENDENFTNEEKMKAFLSIKSAIQYFNSSNFDFQKFDLNELHRKKRMLYKKLSIPIQHLEEKIKFEKFLEQKRREDEKFLEQKKLEDWYEKTYSKNAVRNFFKQIGKNMNK